MAGSSPAMTKVTIFQLVTSCPDLIRASTPVLSCAGTTGSSILAAGRFPTGGPPSVDPRLEVADRGLHPPAFAQQDVQVFGALALGQVGVGDNIRIGDRVICGGAAKVISNVPSGQGVQGYPAMPMARFVESYKALRRLPRLLGRLGGR